MEGHVELGTTVVCVSKFIYVLIWFFWSWKLLIIFVTKRIDKTTTKSDKKNTAKLSTVELLDLN